MLKKFLKDEEQSEKNQWHWQEYNSLFIQYSQHVRSWASHPRRRKDLIRYLTTFFRLTVTVHFEKLEDLWCNMDKPNNRAYIRRAVILYIIYNTLHTWQNPSIKNSNFQKWLTELPSSKLKTCILFSLSSLLYWKTFQTFPHSLASLATLCKLHVRHGFWHCLLAWIRLQRHFIRVTLVSWVWVNYPARGGQSTCSCCCCLLYLISQSHTANPRSE